MPTDDVSHSGSYSGKPVQAITYPVVQIHTLLKVTHKLATDDTIRKVHSAYRRLVPNKTRFNHHILAQLYNLFFLPYFVCTSLLWECFTQADKKKLFMIYFKYGKCFLVLPPWTSNQYLIQRFGLIDPDVAVPMRVINFQSKSRL